MASKDNKNQEQTPETNNNQQQVTLALQQEIDVLKAKNSSLNTNNQLLEEKIKKLEQTIETLQTDKKEGEGDKTLNILNEQIEQLTSENKSLQKKINNLEKSETDSKESERIINNYEEKLLNQQEEIKTLKDQLEKAQLAKKDSDRNTETAIKDFKSKLETAIILSPIALKIVTETANKLSEKYKRDITNRDIVNDYIIRYNIQRWSQWFHPFVLSDKEILAMAQEDNPEIKSINELKARLGIAK